MERLIENYVSYTTIRRLPMYMPLLKAGLEQGQANISSAKIAEVCDLDPVLVRKDLAGIGITGQARLGFPVSELIDTIERFLGWDNVSEAFVIGAGNLGRALAGYVGFEQHGLKIIALFDNDPGKVGTTIAGKPVMDSARFAPLADRMRVPIAILTVPPNAAQDMADMAVAAGIKAIWNFTPTKLQLPEDVIVEQVDLAASLAVLSSRLVSAGHGGGQHEQQPEILAR